MNPSLLDDIGKLILRLGFGILFLMHGAHKLMNHPDALNGIVQLLVNNSLPAWLAYGVYAGEVLAPVLIILGLYARIGALLTTITMVFAIYLVHMHELMDMTVHGGWALELQGMFLLASLAILFSGPGRLSLNRR